MIGSHRARLSALAVLAGLLLVGCGTGSPGTAATVEGQRLTVAEVQERTAAFFEAYPEARSAGLSNDQIASITVENFIRAVVVDAAAAELGLEPTQTELDALVEQIGGIEEVTRRTSGQGVPPDPELVAVELRSAFLQGAIGEEVAGADASSDDIRLAIRAATDAKAAELDIVVNPRFGTWNGSTVETASGSISVPAFELDAPTGEVPPPGGAVPPAPSG